MQRFDVIIEYNYRVPQAPAKEGQLTELPPTATRLVACWYCR